MLHSVRARLAVWYAASFALFLGLFAVAVYLFVAHASLERVDEALDESSAAVAGALRFEATRIDTRGMVITDVLGELRFPDLAVVVWDPAKDALYLPGRSARRALVAGHVRLGESRLTRLVATTPITDGEPTFRTVGRGAGAQRVIVRAVPLRGGPVVVGVARSLGAHRRLLEQAGIALAVIIPVMLALATAGGYWLARASLAPVVVMSDQARRLGASNLHERLPVANERDELGHLAAAFNALLARLDDAFDQQRRFMADASHELRTPVAIVGGEAEHALARADRPAPELRAALGVVREESHRLRRIVDDLFLLARADGGDQPLAVTGLYLDELVAECVRAVRSLAAPRRLTLAVAAGEELPFRGDESLLRRMVLNLLDNAIKYTPPGGRVTATATRRGDRYVVEVADTGPGVPEEARARIFDRFYRAPGAPPDDPAADDVAPSGAGLGLAIVRWVAARHGGEATLARTGPDGSVFAVALPAPAAVAPAVAAEARAGA